MWSRLPKSKIISLEQWRMAAVVTRQYHSQEPTELHLGK
jgi:hypothetical protein